MLVRPFSFALVIPEAPSPLSPALRCTHIRASISCSALAPKVVIRTTTAEVATTMRLTTSPRTSTQRILEMETLAPGPALISLQQQPVVTPSTVEGAMQSLDERLSKLTNEILSDAASHPSTALSIATAAPSVVSTKAMLPAYTRTRGPARTYAKPRKTSPRTGRKSRKRDTLAIYLSTLSPVFPVATLRPTTPLFVTIGTTFPPQTTGVAMTPGATQIALNTMDDTDTVDEMQSSFPPTSTVVPHTALPGVCDRKISCRRPGAASQVDAIRFFQSRRVADVFRSRTLGKCQYVGDVHGNTVQPPCTDHQPCQS